MTITLRQEKGISLEYEELDENFRDLRYDTTLDRVIENGNTTNRSITVGNLNVAGNLFVSNDSILNITSENIESDNIISTNIVTDNLQSNNFISLNTISTNTLIANTFTANVFTNFIESNQSLSANGYQRFPGGLIIQWGSFTAPSSGGQATVTFPLAFPTACVTVQIIKREDGGTGGFGTNPGLRAAPTTTQANFSCQNNTINYWMAIGY
jgi:hypothetical protein